jgi:hypothetical protein
MRDRTITATVVAGVEQNPIGLDVVFHGVRPVGVCRLVI